MKTASSGHELQNRGDVAALGSGKPGIDQIAYRLFVCLHLPNQK